MARNRASFTKRIVRGRQEGGARADLASMVGISGLQDIAHAGSEYKKQTIDDISETTTQAVELGSTLWQGYKSRSDFKKEHLPRIQEELARKEYDEYYQTEFDAGQKGKKISERGVYKSKWGEYKDTSVGKDFIDRYSPTKYKTGTFSREFQFGESGPSLEKTDIIAMSKKIKARNLLDDLDPTTSGGKFKDYKMRMKDFKEYDLGGFEPKRDFSDPAYAKEMQELLIKKGYDLGSTGADSVWGTKSKAAWEQYQEGLKISPANDPYSMILSSTARDKYLEKNKAEDENLYPFFEGEDKEIKKMVDPVPPSAVPEMIQKDMERLNKQYEDRNQPISVKRPPSPSLLEEYQTTLKSEADFPNIDFSDPSGTKKETLQKILNYNDRNVKSGIYADLNTTGAPPEGGFAIEQYPSQEGGQGLPGAYKEKIGGPSGVKHPLYDAIDPATSPISAVKIPTGGGNQEDYSQFIDASGGNLKARMAEDDYIQRQFYTDETGQRMSEGFGKTTSYGKKIQENPNYVEFKGTAEQNIELLNSMVRGAMPSNSSLQDTWDFNKAQQGKYDSPEMKMGWNEEAATYRTYKTDDPIFKGHEPVEYQDGIGVVEGLFEGINYYSGVELKGQGLKEMWSSLGYGEDWDNRETLWNTYQDEGRERQVASNYDNNKFIMR